ncbi:MAG: flagellar protein FlgN [Chloroflexi bacterium]|nr:flagellar protein FlgN [Chloroflexota bacterium]MDA1241230.1 flagellar protein FlgN [Chloroflexota bacterium]
MTAPHGLVAGADGLVAVMAAQGDLYRSLLVLAGVERTAIVEGDVVGLTEIVARKEELLDHLRALETERMTALVAIEVATGIVADEATVSAIAARLPAGPADTLVRAGRELRGHAIALEEAQDINTRLLERSRTVVDRWLQYLRTLLAGSVYTSDGPAQVLPGGRALDRSA